MAFLNYCYCSDMIRGKLGRDQPVLRRNDTQRTLTASGTSAIAPDGTSTVRVVSDSDSWIRIGKSPSVPTVGGDGCEFLPAGTIEYFPAFEGHQIYWLIAP